MDQDGTARRRSRVRRPGPERAVDGPGGSRRGADQGEGGSVTGDRDAGAGRDPSGRRGVGATREPPTPDVDRGLRGLVGAGPSQVSVLAALRARDAARPTAEDLAAAERELTVVRRQPVPPEAAGTGGRDGRAQPGSGGSSPERS